MNIQRLLCRIGIHDWERTAVNTGSRHPYLQKYCPHCQCLKTKSELSNYKWQTIVKPVTID